MIVKVSSLRKGSKKEVVADTPAAAPFFRLFS